VFFEMMLQPDRQEAITPFQMAMVKVLDLRRRAAGAGREYRHRTPEAIGLMELRFALWQSD
jgi:hypothetical protein